MKVISQDGAIAAIAVVADEFKPLKGVHLPDLLKAVAERYEAVKAPTLDEARGTGAKFQNCRFMRDERQISIREIGTFNDALTVTTSDTDDSEFVLNDLYAWLQTEFKFREPMNPVIKFFQSDLIVQFDNNPDNALGGLSALMKFISAEMTPPNAHVKKPIQFGYIGFGADPIGPGFAPEFNVVRRLNLPWRLGLYFCKAHMRTSAHIKALSMLDILMGKTS